MTHTLPKHSPVFCFSLGRTTLRNDLFTPPASSSLSFSAWASCSLERLLTSTGPHVPHVRANAPFTAHLHATRPRVPIRPVCAILSLALRDLPLLTGSSTSSWPPLPFARSWGQHASAEAKDPLLSPLSGFLSHTTFLIYLGTEGGSQAPSPTSHGRPPPFTHRPTRTLDIQLPPSLRSQPRPCLFPQSPPSRHRPSPAFPTPFPGSYSV